MTNLFSPEELSRYSRQILLPEVGIEGQRALKSAKVLVVGLGGLGSPAALYLAGAGVGKIGLVDFDEVDLTNLHRQILYDDQVIGQSKAEVASRVLSRLNSNIKITVHKEKFSASNAEDILSQYDFVIDGSDNFATHYLLNDSCFSAGKVLIFGGVHGFQGQISTFIPNGGPCYRCLYPDPPSPHLFPSCSEAGVLGIVPGTIGILQATEVLKLIIQQGNPLVGRLLVWDGLEATFREFKFGRDLNCALCGTNSKPLSISHETSSNCCSGISNSCSGLAEIEPAELKRIIRTQTANQIVYLDVRQPWEFEASRIAGANLIPLQELPSRFQEIDRGAEIIVYCKSGKRGTQAVSLLNSLGFSRVRNLKGGLDAYHSC